MRAYNLTAPTLNPSYENAIQAGSLSHVGNSARPIGAPVKVVSGRQAAILQPASYEVGTSPIANPVHVSQRIATVGTPHGVASRPVAHVPTIRGILGQ